MHKQISFSELATVNKHVHTHNSVDAISQTFTSSSLVLRNLHRVRYSHRRHSTVQYACMLPSRERAHAFSHVPLRHQSTQCCQECTRPDRTHLNCDTRALQTATWKLTTKQIYSRTRNYHATTRRTRAVFTHRAKCRHTETHSHKSSRFCFQGASSSATTACGLSAKGAYYTRRFIAGIACAYPIADY